MRARPDGQVLACAAQMDDALEQGLTVEQLIGLVESRACWWLTGEMPPLPADVVAALTIPAARAWDEVFVAAARQAVRGRRGVG